MSRTVSALVLLSLFCLLSVVTAQGNGAIRLVNVRGEVSVRYADGRVEDAQQDMALFDGNVVVTGRGTALIAFSNGANIVVRPRSEFEISEFSETPAPAAPERAEPSTVSSRPSVTRLKLLKGEIVGRVDRLDRRTSRFEIETPVGVAGIRGTIFRFVVTLGAGNSINVESQVPQGSVNFSYNGPVPGEFLDLLLGEGGEGSFEISGDYDIDANGNVVVDPGSLNVTTGPISAFAASIIQAALEYMENALFLNPFGDFLNETNTDDPSTQLGVPSGN